MRTRVLILAAVCAILAFGVWLASHREQRNAGEEPGATAEAVKVPAPDTSGLSSPTAPVRAPESIADTKTDSGATPPAAGGPQSSSFPAPAALTNTVMVSPTTASAAGATAPAIPSEEAALDLDKVTLSLRDYRTVMGENPVGTNAEIVKALNGGNPKQARLLMEGLAPMRMANWWIAGAYLISSTNSPRPTWRFAPPGLTRQCGRLTIPSRIDWVHTASPFFR